jgi:hypothetical protein
MFCPSGRTHIALSVMDVEGGELLSPLRDLAGLSLLEQIADVDDRLDTLNTYLRVQADPSFAQPSVRRLPPGAVREAILNGVVHRDWMQHDPVEVTWVDEDSALQVISPGGFTGGVTASNVLTQRHARYPALADLCRALHLVEKQGLGVDRMYRDMIVLGHRPPMIIEEPGPRVRVRLVGGEPVVPVVNLMSTIRPEPRQRDVRVALIVHTLLHQPFTTAGRLTGILQRETPEAREALETAGDCLTGTRPLLVKYKDVWTLSWEAVSAAMRRSDSRNLHLRGVLPYIRPDLDVAELVARDWLTDHDRYTSGDHAVLTGLTAAGARSQLEKLEQAGVLVRGPGSGRSAHFVPGPALLEKQVRTRACHLLITRSDLLAGHEEPCRIKGAGPLSMYAETRTEAWERRAALAGQVDFTMMYIAHDAFNRDTTRLTEAADAGRGLSPAAITTWRRFSKQLHTHHTAEDKALWPPLAAAVAEPAERRILEEMEAEHAALDPRVEQIETAIANRNGAALAAELATLREGLAAHMIHEETDALPLLDRRTGKAGWDAFIKEVRSMQGGIKGAAEYLPWALDGATEEAEATVLQLLPAPARLLYRRAWAPRYRKAEALA